MNTPIVYKASSVLPKFFILYWNNYYIFRPPYLQRVQGGTHPFPFSFLTSQQSCEIGSPKCKLRSKCLKFALKSHWIWEKKTTRINYYTSEQKLVEENAIKLQLIWFASICLCTPSLKFSGIFLSKYYLELTLISFQLWQHSGRAEYHFRVTKRDQRWLSMLWNCIIKHAVKSCDASLQLLPESAPVAVWCLWIGFICPAEVRIWKNAFKY